MSEQLEKIITHKRIPSKNKDIVHFKTELRLTYEWQESLKKLDRAFPDIFEIAQKDSKRAIIEKLLELAIDYMERHKSELHDFFITPSVKEKLIIIHPKKYTEILKQG